MKKGILALAIATFIIPYVAFASWWNPLSWFNNWSFSNTSNTETQVLEHKVAELEDEISHGTASTTVATSTSQVIASTSATAITPPIIKMVTSPVTETSASIETPPVSTPSILVSSTTTPTSYSIGDVDPNHLVSISAIWQNPGLYIGKSITIQGKVSQILQPTNGNTLLILMQDSNQSSGLISFEVDSSYVTNNQIKAGVILQVAGTLLGQNDSSTVNLYQMANASASYYLTVCPGSNSTYCVAREEQQAMQNAASSAAQQASEQQAAQSAIQSKQDKLNAINLQIANLNAQYAQDIKKCSTSGGTIGGVSDCQNNITSQYSNNYNTLMAEFQQIEYSN